MRPNEQLVATAPQAGGLTSSSRPGELLSLIEAIEQKLALAHLAAKACLQASASRSGADLQPGNRGDGAHPARPTRNIIVEVLRKG